LVSGEAKSATLTFDFTATVTSSTGTGSLTGGSVAVGSTISGSYTYDTNTPDSNPDPLQGSYSFSSAPFKVTATAGSNVFETDPNNIVGLIFVNDSYPTNPGPDQFQFHGNFNILPLPSGTVVTGSTTSIFIQGDTSIGGDKNVVNGDGLPTTAPSLPGGLAPQVVLISADGPGGEIFNIQAHLDSLTLRPPTPAENLANLVGTVMNLNLAKGISNSLDAKLDAALGALDDANENNDGATCNTLDAFINSVEAQSGGKISVGDAATLIGDAQAIQSQLGCN
jgi:hypothetical protein